MVLTNIESLPFTGTKIPPKLSTTFHNSEAPFSNKICHHENINRAMRIHKGKLKTIKAISSSPYKYEIKSHKFLDESISKRYKAKEHSEQIFRENMQLLKKLSKLKNPLSSPQSTVSLSQTAALPTNTHTTDKLTPGPKLKKLKEEKRKRDSERISKENLIILKRLQAVRPEYSAEKFRKSQKSHHQCLKLRRTDYTAGHIVTQVSPQSSFHLIAPHRTAPHPPTHKLTTNNK